MQATGVICVFGYVGISLISVCSSSIASIVDNEGKFV
jgi:hypothetical protein